MKLKNLFLFFILHITPLYCQIAPSPITRLNVRRKTSLKDITRDIIHINEQIDQLMHLRIHTKNRRDSDIFLKDIDTLKTLRDVKIRELNKLRKQNFALIKQNT